MQNDIEASNNAVIPAEPEGLAIDLRLSANAMSAGNLRFENLAASITSSEEGWKFDIGNATAFGGSVVGSVGSAIEGDKAQLILKFSSNDTDMDAINVAAGREVSVVSGNVSLTADLRTPLPISDPASIPINGEFSINAASGSIQGIDFLGLLDLAENTEETAPKNLESDGQTDFDTLSINAFLNDSRATVSKGEIQTSERRIQILGDADVLKGSLALTAQEVSDEGPISDRLVIGGTFSNPLVSVKPAPSTKKSKAEEEQSSTEPGSSASH